MYLRGVSAGSRRYIMGGLMDDEKKPFSKAEWYRQNSDRLKQKAREYYEANKTTLLRKQGARRMTLRRAGAAVRGQLYDLYLAELRGGVRSPLIERIQAQRAKRHAYYKKNQVRLRKLQRDRYWRNPAEERRKKNKKNWENKM